MKVHLEKVDKMKVLLFGTGDYYNRCKGWFLKEDILALMDNSPEKRNTTIDGIKVLSPEDGIKLPFDVIVILSFYVRAMRSQLLDLGVQEKQIYHFYELYKIVDKRKMSKPVRYFEKKQKKILLLSHDLTFGGPAIALFQAAEVFIKHGYEVVYGSMLDGPLRDKLAASGISVVVDENLMVNTMQETGWIVDFSLIICNTINFHIFLSERKKDIPIVWWLHDSQFFYDGVDRQAIRKIEWSGMKICSVGTVPEKAIQKILPQISSDVLLYGVEDTWNKSVKEKNTKKKIKFVTIGYIEERKGQDILLQSLGEIPDELKRQACFYLVGQDSSMMAQKMKAETESMPDIFMTGTVGRDRICEILDEADVLICPSREDPMPTVAAEAMMHQVPCIVSDVTGIAEYIQNGMDGLVFRSEDIKELAEKIKWCIENREKLPGIGIRARKIYDTYFSMDVFEKNLLHVVDGMLSQEERKAGMESA